MKNQTQPSQAKLIAATILQQLGGQRFIVMTGSKNFVALEEGGLICKLTRNKIGAKWMKITLTPMDEYNMEFIKLKRNSDLETVKKYEGLYCDQLQEFFTEATGLYTRL